jgi:hypothetical protein
MPPKKLISMSFANLRPLKLESRLGSKKVGELSVEGFSARLLGSFRFLGHFDSRVHPDS